MITSTNRETRNMMTLESVRIELAPSLTSGIMNIVMKEGDKTFSNGFIIVNNNFISTDKGHELTSKVDNFVQNSSVLSSIVQNMIVSQQFVFEG